MIGALLMSTEWLPASRRTASHRGSTQLGGPSGCGKSTMLLTIAGLEDASDGEVWIDGKTVDALAPADRGVAMVFQSYALYPHMSVAQNMGFGLRMAGVRRDEIARRVADAAEILQISELLARRPAQLSGGQRQRVAIGRAITRAPDMLLLDEPLSNLDAELRIRMWVQLAKLHKRLGATIIYVAYDQTEALALADKIVVMRTGRIEQVGPPARLYHDPDNVFVAGFLSSPRMNLVAAHVDGGLARLPDGQAIPLPTLGTELPEGASIQLGIRPEHLDLSAGGSQPSLEIVPEIVESLGSTSLIYARAPDGDKLIVEHSGPEPAANQSLSVHFDSAALRALDVAGRRVH